jgi:site-specific DNA-methyltransferase (adenine-specific)/modification methylase
MPVTLDNLKELLDVGAKEVHSWKFSNEDMKSIAKSQPHSVVRTRDKDNILNHIFEGDCVSTMRTFQDNVMDITITSPPYNVGKTTRGNLYTTYKDDLSMDEYTEWLVEIGIELLRITKHYVFFNIQVLTDNKMAVIDFMHYFRGSLKDIFIWAKTPIPQIAKGKLATGYELIIVLGNDSRMIYDYNNFPDNGFVPNIERWIQQGADRSKEHGATFPIKMPKFFIGHFTKKGDIVFDPFMGTGTTALAAIELGRNYCGTELDEEYYNLTLKRIEERKQDFEFTFRF